jgi:hypothetical protein
MKKLFLAKSIRDFLLLFFVFLFVGCSPKRKSPLVSDTKVSEALRYAKSHNLSTSVCVFIDMRIHSGKKRLFLYDLQHKKILQSGLCSHGCGEAPWGEDETKETPLFSNVSDSHLSSKGKYRIGNRGYSNWGIHVNYKLHGLEATNNKAYSRYIVLHSWEDIGNEETFPEGTPEGWGCPAVSNTQMRLLDAQFKKSNKDILLWIYT